MTRDHSPRISVHRLTRTDSKQRSDRWRMFSEFVLRNKGMYPQIGTWLDSKVAPQLDSASRRALLLSLGDEPIASVVLKRGSSSKLCHVRIDPGFRDQHLGTLLFCLLAHEVRPVAKDVISHYRRACGRRRRGFFARLVFLNRRLRINSIGCSSVNCHARLRLNNFGGMRKTNFPPLRGLQ